MSQTANNVVRTSPRQVSPENRTICRKRAPTREEMKAVFRMCRSDQWDSVLNSIRSNSFIATTTMTMDNNIATTVLHQAITSKADTKKRAWVIQEVLRISCGNAATIKNGYGSLPLHVISQRNTKMDAKTKEILIRDLVDAYPDSITCQGGVGKRTPLHIIFTDYISPDLTAIMIHYGKKACFMRDKNGFLPAHVACSRHVSPEKLGMLLEVNPTSLFVTTVDGKTILDLAIQTATKSHPNCALINEIKRRVATASSSLTLPSTVTSQFDVQIDPVCLQTTMQNIVPVHRKRTKRKRRAVSTGHGGQHKVLNQTDVPIKQENFPIKQEDISNSQADSDSADLLLHFSRHTGNVESV